MILVVKNNAGSVENTIYLTPKEKRGAANVATYGPNIVMLGVELTSLTTNKVVMVNAKALSVTDRFTRFTFDADTETSSTAVDLTGPSWPEGYVQYRVVERANSADFQSISSSDVILEVGLGYLTRGDFVGFILTESSLNIAKEDNGLILLENATTTREAYQETTYTSHSDSGSTFAYHE